MTTGTPRKRSPRRAKPDPGRLKPHIDSFALALDSNLALSANTKGGYVDAAIRLAGWLLRGDLEVDWTALHQAKGKRTRSKVVPTGPTINWADVVDLHIQQYLKWMLDEGYAPGYANQQYRALQVFWTWFSEEEGLPSPIAGTQAPKIEKKLVPVLTLDQMRALIKSAESERDRNGRRTFEGTRDAAILRLFASTGCRLAEIANLATGDVNLQAREAYVVGKGSKPRRVRFDAKAAQALDRYIRLRALRPAAEIPALWIGVRRRVGMTPSGLYQIIARRGDQLGMRIHPHMFRHTFSHRWLDEGGAEGDLMELNGWSSAAMLRLYGASAKAARAARAYDRVNVMGDV